jgi:uncharacterized membrane protein (Fun14 family)
LNYTVSYFSTSYKTKFWVSLTASDVTTIIENFVPIATTIGGGFFIGILLGYFVKKVMKIILFITGGIIGLLLYLQQQQIILVNTERLEHSSTFILTSITSSFDTISQVGNITSFGIPLTVSFTAGFTVGFMKS